MGKRKKVVVNKERTIKGMANAVSSDEGEGDGQDMVYDEVDRWEQEKDAAAMAIVGKGRGKGGKKEAREEVLALSGTDSEDEGEEREGDEEEKGGWGSRKKHYYGGNTGEEMEEDVGESDLEEDRAEEVEASKLQRKQLDDMEEEDFLDTFSLPVGQKVEQEKEKVDDTAPTVTRDLSQLTRKEQLALFKQKAPEFEGVVADFQLKMAEAARLARVAALAETGQLPDGPQMDFVRSKLQLLLNYSTNIAAYLMFRAQGESLTLHPVTGRLVQYRQLLDSLKPMDEVVMPSVEALLQRLDLGEEVSTLVREERRRERRKAEGGRKKKLSLAQKEEDQIVPEKKRKRKKKSKDPEESALENLSALTQDERMAVELYNVIKKSRKNEDLDDESADEDGLLDSLDRVEDAPEESTGATTNDGAEYDEEGEEKRAVTYKMAKNKGLMPKRSKLQRNPRLKNRMKFEKATKKRKGAVRPIRDQQSKYSGEAFGVNARVKKGVKLS